jgi:membrane protein implicated in regulation of membrane protease activity
MKAAFGLRFTFGFAAFLAAFLGAAFLTAFFLGAAFLAAFFGAAFFTAFLAPAFLAGAFFFAFVATVFKIFLVKPDANKNRMKRHQTSSDKKLFTTLEGLESPL